MAEQILVQDSQAMLEKIQALPIQLQAGWQSASSQTLRIFPEQVETILIAGMGGSGLPGKLAQELLVDSCALPIVLWADYQLPHWVNSRTLVIAISYSGNTEETISALKTAKERQAQILVISSGGKIQELATQFNAQFFLVDYNALPRASLGYQYAILLAILTKLGHLKLNDDSFHQVINELEKVIQPKLFFEKAEEIVLSLNNKVPVIFSFPPLTAVAKRWANQFNENSKTFAVAIDLPEACHNLIAGLDFAITEKLMIFSLESRYAFSRNIARGKVVRKVIEEKHIPIIPVTVNSGSVLSEQLLLIYFGDLLSYYLSGVNGIDPTPIETIVHLKQELDKL